MLAITKQNCYDICRLNSVPFVEDDTNQDNNITRNAIRNKVLPCLREIFPQAADHVVSLAQNMVQTQSLVNKCTQDLQSFEFSSGNIRIEALQVSNDIVIYEWLRNACFEIDDNFAIDSLKKGEVDKVITAIRTRQKKTFIWPSKIKVHVNNSNVQLKK
jgi:tRNA(Ile)-lysidine synthase TilS/MesJ